LGLTIVDRRTVTSDKTTENRARFLRRIKGSVKEQVRKLIASRSIKTLDGAGGVINIDRKSIHEPTIHHAPGGNVDWVLPGNVKWVEGDTIPKEEIYGDGDGDGDDDQAGDGDETIDESLEVELTREEFLQYLFEDLELPDLDVTEVSKLTETIVENKGYSKDGAPNRLHLLRSYKESLTRRLPLINFIQDLEKFIGALKSATNLVDVPSELINDAENFDVKTEMLAVVAATSLSRELELTSAVHVLLTARVLEEPIFDQMDLRYRASLRHDIPISHATMFMIMDVSGSMGEEERQVARAFFWILYNFLKKQYGEDKVVDRYIIHTTEAREVEEDEFFDTRASGGTTVSTALDLISEIIQSEGLEAQTNIYIAQISDGDNAEEDNGTCTEILEDDLLPKIRYFAYIQVDDHNSVPSSYTDKMWRSYEIVSQKNPKLQMKRVFSQKDIWHVFRELFQKRGSK